MIAKVAAAGASGLLITFAIIYKLVVMLDEKTMKSAAAAVAQKYGLDLVVLFGSRVTGKTHRESDYDVGYLSARRLDLTETGRLINDLMPVLGAKDERLINLVDLGRAGPLLRRSATDICRVLYEKEPVILDRLRAQTFKQYIEMLPTYEERAKRLHQ